MWEPSDGLPLLDVPTTGLHDPTDMIVLELDEVAEQAEEADVEEEVGVLEMFDESIGRFEQSGFRPRRLCSHFMAGRCERGWRCMFAHGGSFCLCRGRANVRKKNGWHDTIKNCTRRRSALQSGKHRYLRFVNSFHHNRCLKSKEALHRLQSDRHQLAHHHDQELYFLFSEI